MSAVDWGEVKDCLSNPLRRAAMLKLAEDISDGNAPGEDADGPMLVIARQLAHSRTAVRQIAGPHKVGIVFAMWRERARIGKLSKENPNGEDCINDKLQSLSWLFEGTSIDWHLYAVDDDCPEHSHDAARASVQHNDLRKRLSILELGKGWPFATLPLSRLTDLSHSTKGGAIAYGLGAAINDGCDFVCYTDCDNSVHVGELGNLLIGAMGDNPAAFGDIIPNVRTTFINPQRSDTAPAGRLLSHLRKLLMGFESPTNFMGAPFKLFRSSYLKSSLERTEVFDFSFDQWLVLGVTADGYMATPTAFSFLDSYEASTWHLVSSYNVEFQKTNGLIGTLRGLNLPHDPLIAAAFERLVRSPEDIERLYAARPARQMVEGRQRTGDPNLMSKADIIAYLDEVLA